jgi:hypothetical protein
MTFVSWQEVVKLARELAERSQKGGWIDQARASRLAHAVLLVDAELAAATGARRACDDISRP